MGVSILLLSSLTHHQRSCIHVIKVSMLRLSSLTHHQKSCIRVMELSILLLSSLTTIRGHVYV